MNPTKVTLSAKEHELVLNSDWILTKNTIIQKVGSLFGGLSEVYDTILTENNSIKSSIIPMPSPKISKGEKYQGLPWVMLDFPRHFTKSDSIGIRSFFWWGRFCSITLQLSGCFQQQYVASIQHFFQHKEMNANSNDGWFICIGEDAWRHDFDRDNYEAISTKWIEALPSLPFIKLAKKIPLQEWDQLDNFFEHQFAEIMLMLSAK